MRLRSMMRNRLTSKSLSGASLRIEPLEARRMLSTAPVLVADINPGTDGSGPLNSNPSDYVSIGDTVYFFATDAERGRALWKSDGTAEGTRFVYSVPNGGFSGSFQQLEVIHGRLYFATSDDQGGLQFWESNGTTAGTHPITSVPYNVITYEEYAFSTVVWPHLVEAGGTLFFAGRNLDGEYGGEGFSVWKIDDSPIGASVVKSFPSQDDRGPRYLTSVAGKLYFTAPDGSSVRKIWVSDGSLEGTHVVADYQPYDAMVSINDDLYFYTRQTTQPSTNTLWRFEPETEMVNLVGANVAVVGSNIESQPIIGCNGAVYFAGTNGELWSTDETESGSSLVASLYPDEPGTRIRQFAKAGELLYFTVHRPNHPIELWRIDRTANELVLLGQDVQLVNRAFANVDGRLFFSTETLVESGEYRRFVIALFATDGTQAGTHIVASELPGFDLAHWPDLGVSDGRVFFTIDDPVYGEELFMIPASAPGDANDDGTVDHADYSTWADHYLQPGDWGFAQGDFNRDGIVDGADYTIWADHYVPPVVSAAVAAAPVDTTAAAAEVAAVATPMPEAPASASAASLPEAWDVAAPALDAQARRELAWTAAVDGYFARQAAAGSEMTEPVLARSAVRTRYSAQTSRNFPVRIPRGTASVLVGDI